MSAAPAEPAAPSFKTCGCGRAYARADWHGLEWVGVWHTVSDDGETFLELRNCAGCGSTLAIDRMADADLARVWRVQRYALDRTPPKASAVRRADAEPRRVLAKDYGVFTDRELAERVALLAIEKHRADLVVVLPEG